MLELRIVIRLGNDAMQSGADVAAALRAIAADVDAHDTMVPTHAATVWDVNGNRVGQWKVGEGDAR